MEKKRLSNSKVQKKEQIKLSEEQIKKIQICSIAVIVLLFLYLIFRGIPLKIAVVSDTHIENQIVEPDNKNDLEASKLLLSDAVEQINHIKGIDYIMFTGDLTNSAVKQNFEDFYKIANNLKHPYYISFGNHDFYGIDGRDSAKITRQLNPNYFTNKTYYSYCPKKRFCVISLDSAVKNDETSRGELNINQLYFLEEELKNYREKVVLILVHHPLVPPYEDNSLSLYNPEEFEKILSKFKNPIIILSGHYHALKMTQKDNIVHISNPSTVSYPMGFRLVKITDYKNKTKIDVKFVPTRLIENNNKNKLNQQNADILEGKDKDKINSFVIKKRK